MAWFSKSGAEMARRGMISEFRLIINSGDEIAVWICEESFYYAK